MTVHFGRALTWPVVLVLLLLCAPPAAAEGPGYGGTADTLSLAWVNSPAQAMTAPSAGDRLRVEGIGFRANSAVSVRIGAAEATSADADGIGTVVLTIAVGQVDGDPGTVAVAVGRTPAGSVHTLLGAVPPRSSGFPVQTVITWLAVGGLLVIGLTAWRGRRRGRSG